MAITKTGVSLQKLKEQNKLSILQAVREYGPVSRIEIGRMLGLSNTTSMTLARELAAQGFIREKGQGDSSGGRKPVLLEINPYYHYIIGLVLSGEGVSCGIFDLHLNKVELISRRISLSDKKLVFVIQDCVRRILEKSGIAAQNIAGMTIGVGGIVDSIKKNIIGSTHFHSKQIINIQDQMENLFPFPVYLENYGNLMAFAEKKLFYPRCESLALIQVDEGIGGGIVTGSAIMKGTYGYAAEIGHMSIDRNGPPCFCGNRGCIEVLGNIPALLQKAALGLSGQKSRIKDFMSSKVVTIEAIAKAFHENDDLAVRLFKEEANVLYHAVNNIILTSDPEIIVLSGAIALFGQPLIDRIKREIQKTLFWAASKDRKIVFTQLKENPRVYGAGMYAIESFFANPFHYPSYPGTGKEAGR